MLSVLKRFSVIICLIILNISSIYSQGRLDVANISKQGNISILSNMIDAFIFTEKIKNLSVTTTNRGMITIGETNYTIKTGYLNNWEEYGNSEFNVISVLNGSKKILELRNADIWTYTYGGQSMTNYSQYTNNKLCIPIKVSDNISYLLFIGWPYGGDTSLLTIIALTDSDAKLVFNKHMDIISITHSPNEFVIKTNTVIVERDENGRPFNQPDYHFIFCNERGLYYR